MVLELFPCPACDTPFTPAAVTLSEVAADATTVEIRCERCGLPVRISLVAVEVTGGPTMIDELALRIVGRSCSQPGCPSLLGDSTPIGVSRRVGSVTVLLACARCHAVTYVVAKERPQEAPLGLDDVLDTHVLLERESRISYLLGASASPRAA